MAQETPFMFDPFSDEFVQRPYETYHALQDEAPVYWSPMNFWVVSKHKDVLKVLKDARFEKGYVARIGKLYGEQIFDEPVIKTAVKQILVSNPPDHTRVRNVVTQAFNARRVTRMRPQIIRIVDQVIDGLEARGEMDVMRDLAIPVPLKAIFLLLGMPDDDHDAFLKHSHITGKMLGIRPMTHDELKEANDNDAYLKAYFTDLMAERRKKPGRDLLSLLLQAAEEDGTVSEAELISNVLLLFGAGHETTANLIGSALAALHEAPGEWQKMRENPSSAKEAVEELLRMDTSVQLTTRVAIADAKIGDKVIRKGDPVIALIGAANRDPEVFTEPDELHLDRKEAHNLSFGGGPHFCVGARLARLEIEVTLERLFTRLPNLRLVGVETVRRHDNVTLRGIKSLKAVW